MLVNVGGPYRIPGEVVVDLEPAPRPQLLALSYALPDAADELAPFVGEPRIGAEPEPIGQQWSDRRWNVLLGAGVAVLVSLLLAMLL